MNDKTYAILVDDEASRQKRDTCKSYCRWLGESFSIHDDVEKDSSIILAQKKTYSIEGGSVL